MESAVVAMSFPYTRGSHCSMIYRWHAIPQKFNRSQIPAQVLDEHVVLNMQFEHFSGIQMPFCCEKEIGRKECSGNAERRVFILKRENYTYQHSYYGLLPLFCKTFLNITYLIKHRPCLPLIQTQSSLDHPILGSSP